MHLVSFFRRDHSRKFKARVAAATDKIEAHRKDLEILRGRLEARRRTIFASVLTAVRDEDEARASIFGGEHTELRKVIRVVSLCELTLIQVIIRLQSIQDVSDVVRHVNSAFSLMHAVTGSAHDTLPALQSATQQVEAALAVTVQELGQVSPGLNMDVGAQQTEEIVRRAKQYAEERAEELAGPLPPALWPSLEDSAVDRAGDLLPLLKSREGSMAPRAAPERASQSPSAEDDVYGYAVKHGEEIDIIDASTTLRLPVEVVEDALLKLVTTGRLRAPKARERVP